jgi:hypothetical protein
MSCASIVAIVLFKDEGGWVGFSKICDHFVLR